MAAWFAGLFYLPRLFVNHADGRRPTPTQARLVADGAASLYRFITPVDAA